MPTMRGYQRPWLRGDVVAGVTAATVVVPHAMGYATIADLPPQVGLAAASDDPVATVTTLTLLVGVLLFLATPAPE